MSLQGANEPLAMEGIIPDPPSSLLAFLHIQKNTDEGKPSVCSEHKSWGEMKKNQLINNRLKGEKFFR
jgi:hypothetical protein